MEEIKKDSATIGTNEIKSKDELAELIFNLLEDISRIEELLGGLKGDVVTIKDSFNEASFESVASEDRILELEKSLALLKEEQAKITEILESKSDFNLIKDEILDNSTSPQIPKKPNEMNPDMLDKMLFMKERGKWQSLMFIVVLFLILGNIFLFGFLINSVNDILIVSAISILPFLFILLIISRNLKKLNLDHVFGKKQLEFTEFSKKEDLVEVDLPK